MERYFAGSGIIFQQGRVTNIDIEQKQVTVDDDTIIECDRLVLSTGGNTPLNIVPGAKEHAIPFRSLDDAYRLKEQLRLLTESEKDKIRVVIVGGGYSGVELACKISDVLGERGRIRIVDRGTQILDSSQEYNRKTAIKALEERQIWLDLETETTEVTSDTISLSYKGQTDTIPVDLVLWTVGNTVSPLTDNLDLSKKFSGIT